jgi:predicted Zn-dependent peptidase
MKAKFHTLPNGVTLAVIRNKNLRSMVAMAGVHVGSRYEPRWLHGASHFLEHVVFKGTKRFPDSKAVSNEVESVGGEANAFTDKEMTVFHARVPAEHGCRAVGVLHEILANPLLRKEDIEKEKPVVREEISMYENDPDHVAFMASEEEAFLGTGMQHKVTGEAKDVRYTPAGLRGFFRTHYTPDRTVVVLSGNVSDEAAASAASLFGSSQSRLGKIRPRDRQPSWNAGFRFKAGLTDRMHVVVRLPGLPSGAPGENALDIAATAMGGSSTSVLFQELREEKGLCYSVWSGTQPLKGVGYTIVSLSTEKRKFEKAIRSLKDVVKRVRSSLIAEDIERARSLLVGRETMSMDSAFAEAQDFIDQTFVNGSYEDPTKSLNRLRKVKDHEVRAAAMTHFDWSKAHVTVVGPASAEAGAVLSVARALK